MTDRLIDVQAQIEAAASEKSGLALRLEAALDGLRSLQEASRFAEGGERAGDGGAGDDDDEEDDALIMDAYDEARPDALSAACACGRHCLDSGSHVLFFMCVASTL